MQQFSNASAGDVHLIVIKGVDEDAQILRPVEHGPADYICKDSPREICTALLKSGMQELATHYPRWCSVQKSNDHK